MNDKKIKDTYRETERETETERDRERQRETERDLKPRICLSQGFPFRLNNLIHPVVRHRIHNPLTQSYEEQEGRGFATDRAGSRKRGGRGERTSCGGAFRDDVRPAEHRVFEIWFQCNLNK